MIKYKNKYFEGERILYGINDAELEALPLVMVNLL